MNIEILRNALLNSINNNEQLYGDLKEKYIQLANNATRKAELLKIDKNLEKFAKTIAKIKQKTVNKELKKTQKMAQATLEANKKVLEQREIAKAKRMKANVLEDVKTRGNRKRFRAVVGELSTRELRQHMIIVNQPKDYNACLEAVKSTPELIYQNKPNQNVKMYYYSLDSIQSIHNVITKLFEKQNYAFKLFISFGCVYEKEIDTERGDVYEYYCWRPSHSQFFVENKFIKNSRDLKDVFSLLDVDSIVSYIDRQRPSTHHRAIGIYSMIVKIMITKRLIGTKQFVPDWIKNNPNIINPDSTNNMCFWNCVAQHMSQNPKAKTASLGKELFAKFYGVRPRRTGYPGINMDTEISRWEDTNEWGLGVNIFEYDEGEEEVSPTSSSESEEYDSEDDGVENETHDVCPVSTKDIVPVPTLKLIRRSFKEKTINLLRYESHFLYIKHIDSIKNTSFMCEKCGHCFRDNLNLSRHAEICGGELKDTFVKYPAVYEPRQNLIHELNWYYETKYDFRYDPVIVYDFEAMIIKKEMRVGDKFIVKNFNQAVSVSILSNVDGFADEIFIEDKEPSILFKKMFQVLDEICEKAVADMTQKFGGLLETIREKIELHRQTNERRAKKEMKSLKELQDYVSFVPIIGFNSGRYDINLNIDCFMKELKQRGSITSIKTGNTFKCLKSGRFMFLDMMQYIGAGTSLDEYIQAFNKGGLQKYIFPYEFLDSYEKLDYDIRNLQQHDFYSSLKNESISDAEFLQFRSDIQRYGWRTLRDLLRFYNNLDVKPFLDAIENHKKMFHDIGIGIEMFKDGLSLPALAEKIMFSFELKDFNERFLHEAIMPAKRSITPFMNWREKLHGYTEQDRVKKRLNKHRFVTYTTIQSLFHKQDARCLYCWKILEESTWTLDRIDNDRGHEYDNCVLACLKCNTQRMDQHFSTFYRQKALQRYSYNHPLIYLIDEANKDVFYKLKNNITGGASIVFHRYHEAGKTTIMRPVYEHGEWNRGQEGKLVDRIVGFDANALYLWCIGQDMPCGILKWNDYTAPQTQECINHFIDSTYGFIEVDIETPEELYNKFYEFPLIFKNIEYDVKESGKYMTEIYEQVNGKTPKKTKKLISSFRGEKILIKSERLKWMVTHGMVVTKIHGYIMCQRGKVFDKFTQKVSDERRKGDADPDYAPIAEMWKLVGNSAFGRTGMNKNKFKRTVYGDEKLYNKHICTTWFKDATQYDDLYEISLSKRTVRQNIPIQIALSIYDDSKLLMSRFYYDCVDKYISRNDFQYVEMDTDSAYMATTGNLEDIIRPEMRDEFEREKHLWFPRTDTNENANYDKRKPGLFKIEFTGSGIVALSSKLYYVKGFTDKNKYSCKGIQDRNNVDIISFDNYKRALEGEIFQVQNRGMRILDHQQITTSSFLYYSSILPFNTSKKLSVSKERTDTSKSRIIHSYEQKKLGLNPKYDKRIVLDDKVSTIPLNV
jgi:hypothetical protein